VLFYYFLFVFFYLNLRNKSRLGLPDLQYSCLLSIDKPLLIKDKIITSTASDKFILLNLSINNLIIHLVAKITFLYHVIGKATSLNFPPIL